MSSTSQFSRVRRSNGGASPPQAARKQQPLRATVPFQLIGPAGLGPPRGPAPPPAQSCPQAAAAASCPAVVAAGLGTLPASPASSLAGQGGAAAASGIEEAALWAAPAGQARQAPSPERRSPGSPGCKAGGGERQRSARVSPSGGAAVRRAGVGPPTDPIAGAYLTGQWPRDLPAGAQATRDKATQTPRSWADNGCDPLRRTALWESSEQRKEIAKLRHQLQRSKQSGLEREVAVAPFLSVPGGGGAVPPPPSPGRAVAAPARLRGSVEALNQEIERVFVQDAWSRDDTTDVLDGRRAPPPLRPRDSNSGGGGGGGGGGAGVATRSVDTQTPSALESERCRSLPVSPAPLPPLPAAAAAGTLHHNNHQHHHLHQQNRQNQNHQQQRVGAQVAARCTPPQLVAGGVAAVALALTVTVPVKQQQLAPAPAAALSSSRAAGDDAEREAGAGAGAAGASPLPVYVSSPKPNHSYTFMREPPEGCERVTAFEETQHHKEIPPMFCPDKNKVNFVIKSDTAFCPIVSAAPRPPLPLASEPEPAAGRARPYTP